MVSHSEPLGGDETNRPEPGVIELLRTINAEHRRAFAYRGRYRSGENHGAFAIADAEGRRFVLKRYPAAAGMPDRLARAAEITARLHALSYPVPRLVLLGRTAEGDAYSIQEALPGRPPRRRGLLRPSQVQRIVELNYLQADRAVSSEQEWSAYVASVVFEDASGWWGSLRDHSTDTADLADALERLVSGKKPSARRADIVHGDFSPGNILTLRGEVSGVVDWDAAGCGDRAFDLALLLFYHYGVEGVRAPLLRRVLDLAGFDALCVYLTCAILGQTHWSIHHHDASAVTYWLGLARPILYDLRAGTST